VKVLQQKTVKPHHCPTQRTIGIARWLEQICGHCAETVPILHHNVMVMFCSTDGTVTSVDSCPANQKTSNGYMDHKLSFPTKNTRHDLALHTMMQVIFHKANVTKQVIISDLYLFMTGKPLLSGGFST